MIDISWWLKEFLNVINETFSDRVFFVGLQGSYGRGEATEKSDIDVVVILDELSATDIQVYGNMLDTLPHRDIICGFLSGKSELLSWEPSDLFQFYYDTTPILGTLDELLPLIDADAVRRAMKIGVCNIYHGCVHNMVHEKSAEILKELYKSASFVLQAICFLRTGRYLRTKNELFEVLSEEEKMILEGYWQLKHRGITDFTVMSEMLFVWSKRKIEAKDL